MPSYPHLIDDDLDTTYTAAKMKALAGLGVPYSDSLIGVADEVRREQAIAIQASLESSRIKVSSNKEIVALIAYMQRLGQDIKAQNIATNNE